MTTSFVYDKKLEADTIEEDMQDTLDYTIDWSKWLGTDTIIGVVWTVPVGITKSAESNTTTTATVWLSAPALNSNYTISCKITTAAGRIKKHSFIVIAVEH